jgi:hypothetical protein
MKGKAWVCWLIVAMAIVLSEPAKAQGSTNCIRPDPANYDQVYACMSSAHYGNQQTGPNFFTQNMVVSSCQALAMKYAAVMTRAGASREEAIELVPSCAMLAKVTEAMVGKAPMWGACTDYPGHFDAGHMKACLTEFLPLYNRSSLDHVPSCQVAVVEYETALKNSTIVKGRTIANGLPDGYARPTCQDVAAVIGNKGAECQAYAPTIEHVRQCLAGVADRISDCMALRQTYETKLRQSYGGVLPSGYTPLTCQQLDPILAEVKRKQEEARQQAIAASKARAQETKNRRYAAFHDPVAWGQFGGLGDWFKIGMVGLGGGWASWAVSLLGLPFLLSFVVHGVLELWILIRSLKKHQAPGPGGVVDMILRSFGLGSVLRHGPAFAAGTWFLGLLWVPGAVLAIVIGRLIAFGFWSRGVFRKGSKPAQE